MTSKGVMKKDVLGGDLPVKKGVEVVGKPSAGYDADGQIKKFGVKPVEQVEITDPMTGEKKMVTIDRRGTTEEKLVWALANKEMTREQKDAVISMYLFERGKQSASMMMDLWQYKGAHTRESRQFNSMMRMDFEIFLGVFMSFMEDSADLIFKNLPVEVVTVKDDKDKAKEIVRMKAEQTVSPTDVAITLGEIARYFRMTSVLLAKRIQSEKDKRERAKGKGIYMGEDGKAYSIREDDDVVEVVAKDKAKVDAEKS